MNDFDPDDRDRDGRPNRRRDARSDQSSIVHLGINVGVQPLTDLLGGVLDVSGTTDRARGEPGRDDRRSPENRAGQGPSTGTGVGESGTDFEEGEADVVADDYLVDTHRTEDEFVVTAELPGVDEEDLSVGIDVTSNDLVIAVDGRTIDRVDLPWSSTDAAKVWFNNGILEVRLQPADGSDAPDRS